MNYQHCLIAFLGYIIGVSYTAICYEFEVSHKAEWISGFFIGILLLVIGIIFK